MGTQFFTSLAGIIISGGLLLAMGGYYAYRWYKKRPIEITGEIVMMVSTVGIVWGYSAYKLSEASLHYAKEGISYVLKGDKENKSEIKAVLVQDKNSSENLKSLDVKPTIQVPISKKESVSLQTPKTIVKESKNVVKNEAYYIKRSNFYIPKFKYTKSLLLSKDEKYLFASNSTDILMWDIEKRELKKNFRGNHNLIKSMLLTQDGKYLLTASGSSTVMMWSIKKGKIVKKFAGSKEDIRFIALSTDGRNLITASCDGIVKVFDIATKKVLKKFFTHIKNATFALSSDKKHILVGSAKEKLELWSMKKGNRVDIFNAKNKSINRVAFSSDDKYIIAILRENLSYKQAIVVWDKKTKKVIQRIIVKDFPMKMLLTKDNKYIVVTRANGWLDIFDLVSGKKVKSFQGEGGNIESILFNKDESKLFFGTNEGIVNIWDIQKSKEIAQLKGLSTSTIESLFLTHDEKTIVSIHDNGKIVFWSYEKGEPTKVIEDANAIYGRATLGKNEKYMLTQSYATTHLWNLKENKLLKIFQGKDVSSKRAIAFFDNGDSIAVGSNSGIVSIWNIEKREKKKVFRGSKSAVLSIQFSKDERYMLSSTKDMAKLWDVQTQKEIQSFQVSHVKTLKLSANGEKVVWGMYANLIAVYDVEKGKIIYRLKGHKYPISSLKISEDGRYLVSNSKEGYIKLWNLRTGKESQAFRKQYGRLTQFSISKNAKYVVLGMISGNVRVWDIAKEKEKIVFRGKDGIGRALLTKDERYIVSVTRFTGIIKVWDILQEKEIKEFEKSKGNDWISFDRVKKSFKYSNNGNYIFRKKSNGSLENVSLDIEKK